MIVLFLAAALLVASPDQPAKNRLAGSTSPYLRQHASNPVDWYPWGDEAIARARRENRPIFLSIGYSTCHWCHVMERESFSNPDVASVLNEYFVAVKVDREERPDLDSTYLTWLASTNGDTGWPANLLLTPDLVPFWGGTYFPPRARGGRPGLIEVAQRLGEAWRDDPSRIAATAEQMLQIVKQLAHSGSGAVGDDVTMLVRDRSLAIFDSEHGGFGPAPRFPQPSRLMFLLALAQRGDAAASNAVRTTLDRVDAGAIHDHVGGGFHRYVTDDEWHVPHYEKMLYDQAQLAMVFAEASVVFGRPDYLATAVDTLEFVDREMKVPAGLWSGALGAESADSDGVPREGAFYTWTAADAQRAISDPQTLKLVHETYRIGREAAPLYRKMTLDGAAGNFDLDSESADALWRGARTALLRAREERPRPFRDEKVVTAWNAMMVSALARVGVLANDEMLLHRASEAAERLTLAARDGARGLVRSRIDGAGATPAVADDYAWMIRAMLDMFDATGEARWMSHALKLADEFRARLGSDDGDFRRSGDRLAIQLPAGPDDGDSAEPWWASVHVENLARLAAITADPERERSAAALAAMWRDRIGRNPQNWPYMAAALETAEKKPRQIVIAGSGTDEETQSMLELVQQRWRRGEVLVRVDPSDSRMLKLLPHLSAMKPIDGGATAFVCENYTCKRPATSVPELEKQLQESDFGRELE